MLHVMMTLMWFLVAVGGTAAIARALARDWGVIVDALGMGRTTGAGPLPPRDRQTTPTQAMPRARARAPLVSAPPAPWRAAA